MVLEQHPLRSIRPQGLTVDRPLDFKVTQAIREQVSTLTSEQQAILDRNEHRAGIRFIRLNKEYLSSQQKRYMRTARVISTRMDLGDDLTWWDEQLGQQEGLGEVPLNGRLYQSYETVSLQDNGNAISGSTVGRHLWAGRAPFAATPSVVAHMNVLDQEPAKGKNMIEELRLMDTRVALRHQQVSVGNWIAVSIHEKVHGIQNHHLPLPILEIVAYYYEKEFMKAQGWQPRSNEGFEEAVAFWDNLVKKYGENLHRFVFGNLQGEEAVRMRHDLLAEFSPDTMEEIFPQPTDDQPGVVWTTKEV